MASAQNQYDLTVFIGAKVLDILAKLDKVQKKAKETETRMQKLQKTMQGGMDKTKKILKGLQGVMMSVGLGMMFTGMALKNFTQKLLAGLIQTYTTMVGQADPLVNSFNIVMARIDAFKARLIRVAQEKGVFDKWFKVFDDIATRIEKLSDDELADFVNGLIELVIVSTEMMVAGQAILFALGSIAIVSFLLETPVLILVALVAVLSLFVTKEKAITFALVAIAIALAALGGTAGLLLASMIIVFTAMFAVWDMWGDDMLAAFKSFGVDATYVWNMFWESLQGAVASSIIGIKSLWYKFLNFFNKGAYSQKIISLQIEQEELRGRSLDKYKKLGLQREEDLAAIQLERTLNELEKEGRGTIGEDLMDKIISSLPESLQKVITGEGYGLPSSEPTFTSPTDIIDGINNAGAKTESTTVNNNGDINVTLDMSQFANAEEMFAYIMTLKDASTFTTTGSSSGTPNN